MTRTIAIVEDDPDQRAHYAQALRAQDYRVCEYADRVTAVAAFSQNLPDLVILDIILGAEVGAGFEVCRYLRERDPQLPVIFLTSRGDELDKIYGLQMGAWDYQTKPVSLDYLVARIHSLFQIRDQQSGAGADTGLHVSGELEISRNLMQARWKKARLELTPTEFEILCALVEQPDGVSYEGLTRATRQGVVEDNTINTHILHLRKKFRQLDPAFDCIKTRYGFGYRWMCR